MAFPDPTQARLQVRRCVWVTCPRLRRLSYCQVPHTGMRVLASGVRGTYCWVLGCRRGPQGRACATCGPRSAHSRAGLGGQGHAATSQEAVHIPWHALPARLPHSWGAPGGRALVLVGLAGWAGLSSSEWVREPADLGEGGTAGRWQGRGSCARRSMASGQGSVHVLRKRGRLSRGLQGSRTFSPGLCDRAQPPGSRFPEAQDVPPPRSRSSGQGHPNWSPLLEAHFTPRGREAPRAALGQSRPRRGFAGAAMWSGPGVSAGQ